MTEPLEIKLERQRRQDRAILLGWGLAVFMLSGIFSYWIWINDREQDQAMCGMLSLIMTGPEPVAGPAGDRGRAVLAAMRNYQDTLNCR